MINKYTRKKGMTLVEAIISVALFSILIIPISGLVMTAMKTSEKAEMKQRASYVGQGILEEMNIYDEITIDRTSDSFKLLDGGEIHKESDILYQDKGNIIRDDFNVEVTLNKDSNFEYKPSDEEKSNDDKMDFILRLSDDSGQIKIRSGTKIVNMPEKSILQMSNLGNMKLLDKPTQIIDETKANGIASNNKIAIYLEKTFTSNAINIEVENENIAANGGVLEIYVKRVGGATGNLNIKGIKGKVKIYENVAEIPSGEIGDLYNIQVDVKKNSDVLFTGKTTKNIVFK